MKCDSFLPGEKALTAGEEIKWEELIPSIKRLDLMLDFSKSDNL